MQFFFHVFIFSALFDFFLFFDDDNNKYLHLCIHKVEQKALTERQAPSQCSVSYVLN